MAIVVRHEPPRTLTGFMNFLAGLGMADRQRRETENRDNAEWQSQAFAQLGNSLTRSLGTIDQEQRENRARQADFENSMALRNLIGQQQDRRRRFGRESELFEREYGTTPSALAGEVPTTGPGMLARGGQSQNQGLEGPPAELGGPAPIAQAPSLTQSSPPQQTGAPYYAQNPGVVPNMRALRSRLDMFMRAKSMVEADQTIPPQEKAAIIGRIAPHVAALTREYNDLTKRYPQPDNSIKFVGPDGKPQNATFGLNVMPNGGRLLVEQVAKTGMQKATYYQPTKREEAEISKSRWEMMSPAQQEDEFRANIANYDAMIKQGYGFTKNHQTGAYQAIKPVSSKGSERDKEFNKAAMHFYDQAIKLEEANVADRSAGVSIDYAKLMSEAKQRARELLGFSPQGRADTNATRVKEMADRSTVMEEHWNRADLEQQRNIVIESQRGIGELMRMYPDGDLPPEAEVALRRYLRFRREYVNR